MTTPILMGSKGSLLPMGEWYEERQKRRQRIKHIFWSLIGIGSMLVTMYLLLRLNEIAGWVKEVLR